MTFYNVISALLFLGALRVLLVAFDVLNWPQIFTAGCLTIVIFNDMLSTSYEVESKAVVQYTLPLMMIDLLNFLLLALAMVVISPSSNLFDVPLPRLAAFLSERSFWALITVYWVALIVWTRLSQRKASRDKPAIVLWQCSVAVAFFAQWLFDVSWGRPLVLGYLVLYLMAIRPYVRKRIAPRP